MTAKDLEQLQQVGRHLQGLERVGLVSPARTRSRRRPWKHISTTERAVFPGATTLSRRDWDLDEPAARRFDLLVASNVFMYSPDPARWFAHVLDACACFLLVDLVRRRRSEESEFGRDGDCLRFALGDERPRVSTFFDLDTLGDRLLGARTYPGGANEFDPDPVHVIALVRGSVAGASEDRAAAAIRSALGELGSST